MNPAPYDRSDPYNGFNQLVGVTGADGGAPTSFAYDGNGNQVAKADGLGTTTYAYNHDNRLVGITAPGGMTSSFEYDANGLRTKKSDSTGTRSYMLDGLSVVAEYAPDASKLAWYTQSLARIDEVLSVVNAQGKYWYETDALGSTYAMTNSSGAVVSRSSYDVFGERALASANDVGQTFGFTGREHDQSGLNYHRDRYMAPGPGRWTQADRLGLAPGPNLYAYADSRPTLFLDPQGQFPALAVFGLGGAIGGFFGFLGAMSDGRQSAEQVLKETLAGIAFGVAGVADLVGTFLPFLKMPIFTAVLTNAIIAGLGNAAIQVMRTGSIQSWASILVSVGLTVAVSFTFGRLAKTGALDALAGEMSMIMEVPITPMDMFGLLGSRGSGWVDFAAQTLFAPILYSVQQKTVIAQAFDECPSYP